MGLVTSLTTIVLLANGNAPAWVALLGVVWFVGFFCFVLFGIGKFSGWGDLAQFYRTQGKVDGVRLTWRYIVFGTLFGYNGCVTITAADDGLGLALMWPFRLGHPPLLIPWREIEVRPARYFWTGDVVVLTFDDAPRAPITLKMKDALAIEDAQPQAWADCLMRGKRREKLA